MNGVLIRKVFFLCFSLVPSMLIMLIVLIVWKHYTLTIVILVTITLPVRGIGFNEKLH